MNMNSSGLFDMKYAFTNATHPFINAEKALQSWEVPYERRPDGTIFVPGDIIVSDLNLAALPDLSDVVVQGSFFCNHNILFSLKGAPRKVYGDFCCNHNALSTLEGGPEIVGGSYAASGNHLLSLTGAPREVPGDFDCTGNQLWSLHGGPGNVGGDYLAGRNRLVSLRGAARRVRTLRCEENKLESLEDAPAIFQRIQSDFGVFRHWEDVPVDLRYSPETKALQAELQVADTLQAPLSVSRPLRFRKPLAALVP
jgi:hypothetical protein